MINKKGEEAEAEEEAAAEENQFEKRIMRRLSVCLHVKDSIGFVEKVNAIYLAHKVTKYLYTPQ